jgi:2-polyprenyl-3-methyl-5-hydroxy-6-metoxy-1,4-benzoquinol methylase
MLEKRSYQAELMDDLEGGGPEMARTLDELETINTLLGGYNVVTDAIKHIIKKHKLQGKPLEIADLGCGGGDMLRVLARWGRKNKLQLNLTGIDANNFIVEYAGAKSAGFPEVNYRVQDIFSNEFSEKQYDIILCSLFCHHFTDEQLIDLFSRIKKQARVGVIINDLHRHWFAYYAIKYLTQVLSRSTLIRNDAPLSVARAFKRDEMAGLLQRAGIDQYHLKWMWAFRWQVIF